MKIEFCCEELRVVFFDEGLEIEVENKEVWLETGTTFGGINFCPYCGAKIEISVKDDKNAT